MLSGDKRNTAEYVASVVGIPKEKVREVLISFVKIISYLELQFQDLSYGSISSFKMIVVFHLMRMDKTLLN